MVPLDVHFARSLLVGPTTMFVITADDIRLVRGTDNVNVFVTPRSSNSRNFSTPCRAQKCPRTCPCFLGDAFAVAEDLQSSTPAPMMTTLRFLSGTYDLTAALALGRTPSPLFVIVGNTTFVPENESSSVVWTLGCTPDFGAVCCVEPVRSFFRLLVNASITLRVANIDIRNSTPIIPRHCSSLLFWVPSSESSLFQVEWDNNSPGELAAEFDSVQAWDLPVTILRCSHPSVKLTLNNTRLTRLAHGFLIGPVLTEIPDLQLPQLSILNSHFVNASNPIFVAVERQVPCVGTGRSVPALWVMIQDSSFVGNGHLPQPQGYTINDGPCVEILLEGCAVLEMRIIRSSFMHNYWDPETAVFRASRGAAISAEVLANAGASWSPLDFHCADSVFGWNAAGRGGALSFVLASRTQTESVGFIHFVRTRFVQNSAYSGGGAVYVSTSAEQGNVVMAAVACNATGNVAGNGGVFYVASKGIDMRMSRGIFQDNKASVRGGVLYFQGADKRQISASFVNGVGFVRNSASVDGGVGYISSNSILTVSVGTAHFDYTFAGNQGGVFMLNAETLSLQMGNSQFIWNSARNRGGAIYATEDGCSVRLSDALFEGNRAREGGGLYLFRVSTFVSDNSTFFRNSAGSELPGGRGGAVVIRCFSRDCSATFNAGTVFRQNYAQSGGAAVDFSAIKTVSAGVGFFSTAFDSNLVEDTSAVVHVSGCVHQPVFRDVVFSGNVGMLLFAVACQAWTLEGITISGHLSVDHRPMLLFSDDGMEHSPAIRLSGVRVVYSRGSILAVERPPVHLDRSRRVVLSDVSVSDHITGSPREFPVFLFQSADVDVKDCSLDFLSTSNVSLRATGGSVRIERSHLNGLDIECTDAKEVTVLDSALEDLFLRLSAVEEVGFYNSTLFANNVHDVPFSSLLSFLLEDIGNLTFSNATLDGGGLEFGSTFGSIALKDTRFLHGHGVCLRRFRRFFGSAFVAIGNIRHETAGCGTMGGAIFAELDGNTEEFRLSENCLFEDNHAGIGGALAFQGTNHNAEIAIGGPSCDVSFLGNGAKLGSAIAFYLEDLKNVEISTASSSQSVYFRRDVKTDVSGCFRPGCRNLLVKQCSPVSFHTPPDVTCSYERHNVTTFDCAIQGFVVRDCFGDVWSKTSADLPSDMEIVIVPSKAYALPSPTLAHVQSLGFSLSYPNSSSVPSEERVKIVLRMRSGFVVFEHEASALLRKCLFPERSGRGCNDRLFW